MRKLRELKKSIKVNTSFENLLTEATKKDISYKLLIVSTQPTNPEYHKEFHTGRKLIEQAKAMNIPAYILHAESGTIQLENTNPTIYKIYNEDDDEGFQIEPRNTVAIIRGSVNLADSRLDLVSQLEKAGVCCVNQRQAMEICSDKYRTGLRLADVGLTTPKTALVQNEKTIPKALEIVGEKYPLILKTLRGSKGVGVLFIESRRSLDSTCQLLWKINEDTELLLQSYIKADFDVRVHVLGDTILATMRRDVAEGDFRSNYSRGGEVKSYKLSEDEKIICLKAAKAVGGTWTGVDFIKDKKDNVYILEINSSVGTKGIQETTKENIYENILEYFKDKSKWSRTPTPCGYYETVDIKPFGTLTAKFDTGNSGSPVIHADKMKVKGKKVIWTLRDKTITSDILRTTEINVGGLQGHYDESRYVIKLDVVFLGHNYETEFTLDDRANKTPILFDREFMSRVNVMVNPSKKFLMTTYKEIK